VNDVPPVAVVLLAAGSGERVGADRNKVLLPLDGVPLLAHSVRTALRVDGAHRVVVVVRPDDRPQVADAIGPHLGTHDVWLVDGGEQRHDSEYAALRALRRDIEAGEIAVVAIHDAARPLATAALFGAVIDAAAADGAAVPALPAGQLNDQDGALAAHDRVVVQTPQAFAARALLAAYDAAQADQFVGTDTASCLERYADLAIRPVRGEPHNLKVTFADDLLLLGELISGGSGS
jgi:2-C-methyl-D-erythritol 4-phosphate cytidylyltransferase